MLLVLLNEVVADVVIFTVGLVCVVDSEIQVEKNISSSN